MNLKILVLLAAVSLSYDIGAEENIESPEVMFAKAQSFSANRKYKKALREYEKINNKGHDVLLNMGSCAYKMGKLGRALLYWRRAERSWNWSDRAELLSNIKKAQARIGAPVETGAPGLWHTIKSWTFSLLVSAPMLVLQLLFLVVWILLAFYLKRKDRDTQKKAARPLFALTLLLGSIVFGRFFVNLQKYAIVTAKEATLRSGPGIDYPILGKIYEGTEGVVKVTSDGFFKVNFSKNRMGWVSTNDIEKV